jgi:hypothetical protein
MPRAVSPPMTAGSSGDLSGEPGGRCSLTNEFRRQCITCLGVEPRGPNSRPPMTLRPPIR